jgi:hypothetical protein
MWGIAGTGVDEAKCKNFHNQVVYIRGSLDAVGDVEDLDVLLVRYCTPVLGHAVIRGFYITMAFTNVRRPCRGN